MPLIKNKSYNEFKEKGMIELVEDHHIELAFKNIKGKHKRMSEALLVTLYLTGARPAEVLELRSKDVFREKSYVMVALIGMKRGLPRTLYFPYKKKLVNLLWMYARSIPPEAYLFYRYRSKYIRGYLTKKGELREKPAVSNNLWYYVHAWMDGVFDQSIPPYYFRHSRFSKFMQKGASGEDVKFWKGARSLASVDPYTHMSAKTSKRMSKMI